MAENAQYITGVGLVIADDLLAHIGRESLSRVDVRAAYVVRITKPVPAWFFTYGIGINLLPVGGCSRIRGIGKTFAEQWGLSRMMRELDPRDEYKLRTEYMLIDLKATEGRIVQVPKDEDVVRLHLSCQGAPAPAFRDPLFNHARKRCPPMTEEARIKRGLRTLDRRRYSEAGLVPPPERLADLKKIQAAIDKKTQLDPTVDDDSEPGGQEEEEESVEKDLLGKILHSMGGSVKRRGPVSAPTEKEDLFGDLDGDEEGDVPPAEAARTPKTFSRRPKKTNLQAVLRTMRAQTRTRCPRRLDTYLQDPPSDGDMEQ